MLNPSTIGLLVVSSTFLGSLSGMAIRKKLPDHHLESDSKDTIKLAIGLIATMTALILSFVTATAKNSFDTVDKTVKQTSIEVLALDRLLARYGDDTRSIRKYMQETLHQRLSVLESESTYKLDPSKSQIRTGTERIADAIRELKPADKVQASLQSDASAMAEKLLQVRWMIFAGSKSSIPAPFVDILIFWLTVIFTSYGLLSPSNKTVMVVHFLCAMSVGCAVFLLLEMDDPFSGLIRISTQPLEYAYSHMNQ